MARGFRRRSLLRLVAGGTVTSVSGCSAIGGTGFGQEDSDGDGVVNTADYAPWDESVQEKSDLQGTPADPTGTPDGTPGSVAPTGIAEGLSEQDAYGISNADGNGRLHLAYSKGRELRYARVRTSGKMEVTRQLTTMENPVIEVAVRAGSGGRAHVVSTTTREGPRAEGRAQVIERTTVGPGGSTTVSGTVKAVSGSHWLDVFDVLVVGDRLFVVGKDSPDGSRTEVKLWKLGTRSAARSVRTLDVPSSQGRIDGVQVGRRNDRLFVGWAYGRKLTGPGTLGMNTYAVSGTSIERQSKTAIPSEGESVNWRLPSLVVGPDGRVVLGYARGPKGSLKRGAVVVYDPERAAVERTLYTTDPADSHWHADLLFDRRGRLYLGLRSRYRVFTPSLEPAGDSQPDIHGIEFGLNGRGYPSLLGRTPGGRLVYRGLL